MDNTKILFLPTTPFEGQRPGTSGLRKKNENPLTAALPGELCPVCL